MKKEMSPEEDDQGYGRHSQTNTEWVIKICIYQTWSGICVSVSVFTDSQIAFKSLILCEQVLNALSAQSNKHKNTFQKTQGYKKALLLPAPPPIVLRSSENRASPSQ